MPRARDPLRRIRVLLVSPKSPGNVGAVARAVKNMGLGGMAIVEPKRFRDPAFFADEARKLAAHAADVLARARAHATLDDAVTASTYLVATSAKASRSLPIATPREAAARVVEVARARPVAILFGPEDRGLPNRLVARASEGIRIPAARGYPVLNLAQAVMVVAYELRLAAAAATSDRPLPSVPRAELDALHAEAEAVLGRIDFLKPHNRARVFADLARLLARAAPEARDVRMLRGICRQMRWAATRAGRDQDEPEA